MLNRFIRHGGDATRPLPTDGS